MNGRIVKDINKNVGNIAFLENEELNKKITVKIDKKLLSEQDEVNDMLIEVGCNDFYELAFDEIKIVTNYIKKVNLNNPSKQGIMGKIFGIDMAVDYVSMTHSLYHELFCMTHYMAGFKEIILQIDTLENKYKQMIDNNDFANTTLSNKVVFLGQIKALQELKNSILILENCFRLILENPDIQKFCYYWKKFKKNYKFPKKCVVNDNAYLLEEYLGSLTCDKDNFYVKIKNKNFFDLYNEILVVVNLIKKYSKYSSAKFDMFVGMRYLYLRFGVYKNNVILDMVEKIKSLKNNLEEKRKNESNEKTKDKYDRQLLALQLMINEFLKLQLEVKKIVDDLKISMYAKKEGLDIDVSDIVGLEESRNRGKVV